MRFVNSRWGVNATSVFISFRIYWIHLKNNLMRAAKPFLPYFKGFPKSTPSSHHQPCVLIFRFCTILEVMEMQPLKVETFFLWLGNEFCIRVLRIEAGQEMDNNTMTLVRRHARHFLSKFFNNFQMHYFPGLEIFFFLKRTCGLLDFLYCYIPNTHTHTTYLDVCAQNVLVTFFPECSI